MKMCSLGRSIDIRLFLSAVNESLTIAQSTDNNKFNTGRDEVSLYLAGDSSQRGILPIRSEGGGVTDPRPHCGRAMREIRLMTDARYQQPDTAGQYS